MRVTIRQLRRFVQEALDVDDDMNRIAEPVGEKLGNDDPDLQVEISIAELRSVVREALGAYVTDYKTSSAKGGLATGPWPELGDHAVKDDYDDRHDDSEEDWPGPTGGSAQKTNRDKQNNEVQSLGRRSGKPTMRLGTSIADEDEDGFLEEAASPGQDVMFAEDGNDHSHYFFLLDGSLLSAGDVSNAVLGGIIINRLKRGWEVQSVSARHGFGPLLYKAAMEFATPDGGLTSHTGGVTSDDADAVWKRFKADSGGQSHVKHESDIDNRRGFFTTKEHVIDGLRAKSIDLDPKQLNVIRNMVRGLQVETVEFGYQPYPRFMNYNDEMIIGPEERKEREQTWQQALDLFQMYGKEMGAKTPSDPGFIEFARNELAKDGTSDDAISVTLGRLENSNGG